MTCNHNNIVQDKPNRVYKCSDCGEVVGHFWTPEKIAAEREEERRWLERHVTLAEKIQTAIRSLKGKNHA